jgi:hypothetical protein
MQFYKIKFNNSIIFCKILVKMKSWFSKISHMKKMKNNDSFEIVSCEYTDYQINIFTKNKFFINF